MYLALADWVLYCTVCRKADDLGVTKLHTVTQIAAGLGLHNNTAWIFVFRKQTVSFPTGNSYIELKLSAVPCYWIGLD